VGQLRNLGRGDGAARLIILGLDPSLSSTGWGIIRADGNRLSHIANGQVKTRATAALSARLLELATELDLMIAEHRPEAASAEEVFVNQNPGSTLKLAQARGVALLCAARASIEVGEYAPTLVKKAVVGTGGASKDQVHAMVARLLPGAKIAGPDAADALAVAITHAHHLTTQLRSSRA
jgi:crossover junction endodeoxyribonuclease RuvC